MPSSLGHRPLDIVDVEVLSPRVKKIVLEGNIGANPGQYVMIWVPKIGEIPVSVARELSNEIWFLIAKVGRVSSAIHSLRIGDRLWIRGPYGKGFSLPSSGRVAMVGGGYGIAPLLFLAERIREARDAEVRFYAGFRTREEVLLEDLLGEIADELVISTDDGSYGLKGFITEHVNFDWPHTIYTAGPEPMMVRVVGEALKRGIRVEASLERLIRCAVGVCGACSLDPTGLLVCRDGPVFDGDTLAKTRDFGRYWRDFSGRKVPLLEH